MVHQRFKSLYKKLFKKGGTLGNANDAAMFWDNFSELFMTITNTGSVVGAERVRGTKYSREAKLKNQNKKSSASIVCI